MMDPVCILTAVWTFCAKRWDYIVAQPMIRSFINLEPDTYPIITACIIIMIVWLGVWIFFILRPKSPSQTGITSAPRAHHRREKSSQYPPGMQVDLLVEKWASQKTERKY
jgi:hypothetical protein